MRVVVSVPVWDYNEIQFTHTNNLIEQFQNSVNGDWLLVIVDNGSTFEITKWALDSIDDPRIHIIRNETNFGYGKAANQGIKYGLDNGCEYGVVLNNDVVFNNPDWIHDSFVQYLEQNKDWLMGARYIVDNGMTDFGNGCIPYLEGWCYAFHKDLWVALGGFDENYLAYMEDVDLCKRAVDAGYTLVVSPSFEWAREGGFSVARFVKGDITHIGGRTGYSRPDFNFWDVTVKSIEYFKNKFGY